LCRASPVRARVPPLRQVLGEALLRCLRQGMTDRSSDDRLAALQTVVVLILDDLGVEHRTPWAFEKLYALLHTRAETGRATLITANLPLDLLTPVVTGEAVGLEPTMRRQCWSAGSPGALVCPACWRSATSAGSRKRSNVPTF